MANQRDPFLRTTTLLLIIALVFVGADLLMAMS
jgi:hypothetical protein